MRLSERHTLPVPLAEAWAVLNDVATLRRALPHCESLVEVAPDTFEAAMAVPMGLSTSRFTVQVQRRDVAAPHRCTLHFETQAARTAGAGNAVLALAADGAAATLLQADIDVEIEGVIGVLGAPLIELAAHEMARQFFTALRALAVARHARARTT